MTELLVTGGTGTLGRHVVSLLTATGVRPRVLSRRAGAQPPGAVLVRGDTVAGEGLTEATRGVDTVLHLAGGPRGDDIGAGNIVAACERAGVGHLVVISVIGADRLPIGFYRRKAAAEAVVEKSAVPHTILRAAQFHDFVLRGVSALAALPVVPVPRGVCLEPVETLEVARRVVDLALGSPSGRVADLAGPEILPVSQVLRQLQHARGTARTQVSVPLPGAVGRAYREGRNLAGPGAHRGSVTWGEFLAASTAVSAARP